MLVADHGHLFGEHRGPDMITTAPTGETLEIKKAVLDWEGWRHSNIDCPSFGCRTRLFRGFGVRFPNRLVGTERPRRPTLPSRGISLQEMVIPVVTFRIESPVATKGRSHIGLSGLPPTITNRMFSVTIKAQADLLAERLDVRVFLFSGADQVGQTGMVLNADWDRETGVVTILPGIPASVGLMLSKDDGDHVKVVVTDAKTEALLAESGDIPLKLGV